MPRTPRRSSALLGAACLLGIAGALAWGLAADEPSAASPRARPSSPVSTVISALQGLGPVEQDAAPELVPVAGTDEDASPRLDEADRVPPDSIDSEATPDAEATELEREPVVAPSTEPPHAGADAGAPPGSIQPPEPDAGAPPGSIEPPEPDEPPEQCGLITCGTGFTCCNASCGTCVPDGETCDQMPCESRLRYPFSTMCGQNTCSVDEFCCNPTCGTCAAVGSDCDHTPCEPKIRYFR